MHPIILAVALSSALFAGVLVCLELGYRLGKKEGADDPAAARAGVGAVEGALFGLLGLLAGQGMSAGKRRLSHYLLFATVTATTMYLIFDLEYPRFGLIRVEADDQVLHDLRASMH
jgi:hypothetical protein